MNIFKEIKEQMKNTMYQLKKIIIIIDNINEEIKKKKINKINE